MPTSREFLEDWFRRVWTEEDPGAVDEMFAPDAAAGGLGSHPTIGPEEFKAFQRALLALVGEVEVRIDHCMADGPWTSVLCSVSARSRATGEPVRITGTALVRIADGRIAEAYNHFDFLGLFQQLGLMPEGAFERCLCGEGIA